MEQTMRRWLVVAVTLVFALTFLSGLLTWIGLHQQIQPSVAMLRLDICKAPCWIGITLGETSWIEAKKLLHQIYNVDNGYELNIYTSAYNDGSGEIQEVIIRNEKQAFYFIVEFYYEINSDGMEPIAAIRFRLNKGTQVSLSAFWSVLEQPASIVFYDCCKFHNNEVHILDATKRIGLVTFIGRRLNFDTVVHSLYFYVPGQDEWKGALWENRAWKGFTSLEGYKLPTRIP